MRYDSGGVSRWTGVSWTARQGIIAKTLGGTSGSEVKTQRIRKLPGKKRHPVAKKWISSLTNDYKFDPRVYSGQTKWRLELEQWRAGTRTTVWIGKAQANDNAPAEVIRRDGGVRTGGARFCACPGAPRSVADSLTC